MAYIETLYMKAKLKQEMKELRKLKNELKESKWICIENLVF